MESLLTMPNRLIREGLMESEAVLSLPVEARWLFIIIILSADDLGLFEATEFKLARRADVNRDLAGKLMQMIADADLVRLYEVGGKRYGFIPKFRQRLQIKRTKHPLPPDALYLDDEDASSKINDLATKTTVGHPLDNGNATVGQPSEPEPEPEDKKSSTKTSQRQAADRLPDCPHLDLIGLFGKHLPMLPQPKPELWRGRKAAAMKARWVWTLTTKSSKTGELYACDADSARGFFDRFFGYVAKSDFLTGRNGAWTGCNLAWLMNEENFAKAIEGQYENKAAA